MPRSCCTLALVVAALAVSVAAATGRAARSAPVAAANALRSPSGTAPGSAGVAQNRLDRAHVRRLIADLDRASRREAAIASLCHQSEAVVPLLLDASTGDPDAPRTRALVVVLRKLGQRAVGAVPRLLELLDERRDVELQRETLRALGAVGAFFGPCAEDRGARAADGRRAELHAALSRRAHFRRNWIEAAVAARRIQLGPKPDRAELAAWLRSVGPIERIAAARLLADSARGRYDPLVRAALLEGYRRSVQQSQRAGAGPYGEREALLATSRALATREHGAPDGDARAVAPTIAAANGYLLGHFDVDVRLAAVRRLQLAGDAAAAALPQMLRALEVEADRMVARELVVTLGMLGGRAMLAVPALHRQSRCADKERRVFSRHALGRILPDLGPSDRLACEFVIGGGERRAALTPRLIAAGEPAARSLARFVRHGVQGDPDTALEESVVVLAERLGAAARPLVPVLLDVIEHRREPVARRALAALGELGPAIADALPDLSSELQKRVGRAPHHLLVQEMWQALGRIRLCETSSEAELVEALAHACPYFRLRAARLLGGRGPAASGAVAPLRRTLQQLHPDEVVARWVTESGRTESVAQWTDLDDEIQLAAARALVAIAPDEEASIAAHARLLEDGAVVERRSAARALGRFRGRRAGEVVEALVGVFGDDDAELLAAALGALAELASAARVAVPDIELLLDHEDGGVAAAARSALARIR